MVEDTSTEPLGSAGSGGPQSTATGNFDMILVLIIIYLCILRLQIGASPDHFPLCEQTLFSVPTSSKPSLQLYIALDPSTIPDCFTLPLAGSLSLAQEIFLSIIEMIMIMIATLIYLHPYP